VVEPTATVARTPALEAVFKPVEPPTTFEETVERLGTAIRLGILGPGTQLPPEREPRTRSEVVSEVLDRHGISEQDRDEIVQEVLSSLDAELHDQIKSKRGKVADLNQQLETAERELRELVRAYSEGRKPLE
jgi:DNA-binding FadR family transcriptional regulator